MLNLRHREVGSNCCCRPGPQLVGPLLCIGISASVIFMSTFICFCHLVLACSSHGNGHCSAPSHRGKGSSKPRSPLMRLSESTSLLLIGYYFSNRPFPERSLPGRHCWFFSLLWYSIMLLHCFVINYAVVLPQIGYSSFFSGHYLFPFSLIASRILLDLPQALAFHLRCPNCPLLPSSFLHAVLWAICQLNLPAH